MSKITRCTRCGGNIVAPAYPGDGDYPVEPMCRCNEVSPTYSKPIRCGAPTQEGE